MKKLILVPLFLIIGFLLPGPIRVAAQERVPTKADLEKILQELDPEAKEMMKKMGMGMPDLNKISYALSGDYEMDGPVPKRDQNRITKAKEITLNAGDLADYIRRVQQAVNEKAGTQAASIGNEIYRTAKANGGGAQAANGLWTFGAALPAVVVLGNTVAEEPDNPDNLNNYAAFLIMTGAEEGAIPILEYLNKLYPKNSTVLNNLGQAWFGLGDLNLAENFLDSVIAQYAGHSQANNTKSLLRETEGDKAGAVSHLRRSIKTAYSKTKEERLKKLNYQPGNNDITWHTSLPQDPLGFAQMNWPNYPKSVNECEVLKSEWESFREEARQKLSAVNGKFQQAQAAFTEGLLKDPFKSITTVTKTHLKLPVSVLPFSSKAKAKMEFYRENDDALELARYESLLQNNDTLQAELLKLEEKRSKELEELEKRLGKSIGEGGTSAEMEAYCAAQDKINDKYLEEMNNLLEGENLKWIRYWQKTMSRRLNYYQYALPEDAFEMEKLKAQSMWLSLISGQEVRFAEECSFGHKETKQKPARKALADFYDMTCKDKSVMNLGIGSVAIECNKMTTEFEAWFVKYSMSENMDNGKIIKGTVEASFGLAGTDIEYGPVKAEAEAGGSLFIEFDNDGLTDVGVKVGASVELGTNVLVDGMPKEAGIREQKVTVVGAEARWGWNSGCSMENKGLLRGLSLK